MERDTLVPLLDQILVTRISTRSIPHQHTAPALQSICIRTYAHTYIQQYASPLGQQHQNERRHCGAQGSRHAADEKQGVSRTGALSNKGETKSLAVVGPSSQGGHQATGGSRAATCTTQYLVSLSVLCTKLCLQYRVRLNIAVMEGMLYCNYTSYAVVHADLGSSALLQMQASFASQHATLYLAAASTISHQI